jgi:hypothetical protein
MDGAIELVLRPPALSLLLSSFQRHNRVRFFIAVLMRTVPRLFATGDGRWPLAAAALPRPQTLAWRGHGRSRLLLDQDTPVAQSPEPGRLASSPRALLRPKAAVGRTFSRAGPVT